MSDTCDSCGVPATVRAILNRDHEASSILTFCAHHGRRNVFRLKNEGWLVMSGTHELMAPVLDPSETGPNEDQPPFFAPT